MTQLTCSCGYQAEDTVDLTAHFGEMFIPANDTAPDGQVHAENARDKDSPRQVPDPVTLTCRCGFTSDIDGFDEHLLAVFAPADRIGHDGTKHASAIG